jgi:hypothetical protein
MSKNYLSKSFYFTFLIALIFSLLSTVDFEKISVAFALKPINFFSDIQTDYQLADVDKSVKLLEKDSVSVLTDSTSSALKSGIKTDSLLRNDYSEAAIAKYNLPDSTNTDSPDNIQCIHNFNNSQAYLDRFIDKLSSAKSGRSRVRIAWYGDSFTDADLVVGDLRDTLQSVYGGNGVGFMPITHEAPAFRRSVIHSFGGWSTSSIVARNGKNSFGINGHAYSPDSANYLLFAGSKRFKHTRKFDIFRLFYSSTHDVQARVALNDTLRKKIVLTKSSTPEMYSMCLDDIRKVKVNIPNTGGIVFYGASLEDSTGIYIDNFSIKGNSGIGLMSIPNKNLIKFDSLLNYDLIVLQFGLNAINSETRNYTSYMTGMTRLLNKFKKTFPDTPILLVSVSDRSERRQGKYITMESVKGLVAAQKKFACDNELLFWDMYQAMGGENSMAEFVAAKPPLANKDYMHLNFQGGRKIGLKLARSMIYEVKKYQERRQSLVSN